MMCLLNMFAFLLILIAMFTNIIQGTFNKNLMGLHQDNLRLVETITKNFLISPDLTKDYNLTRHQSSHLNILEGQVGQVDEILKLFKGKKNGFFIEAGAFDGQVFSNTLLLEMNYNWTGLLIEPNPKAFQELLAKNRKSYAMESCLSVKEEVTEVSFDVAGLFGGIINGNFKPSDVHQSQINSRHVDKTFKTSLPYYKPYTSIMQCIPLTSIIKALGNPTIDYLSLDIEGAELQVLESISFDDVDIKVISVEVAKLGKIFDGTYTNFKHLMKRNGYALYKTLEFDEIYVKNDFIHSINKFEL